MEKYYMELAHKIMLVCLLLNAHVVHSYETTTHEEITQRSYELSVIATDELLFEQLGIEPDEEFSQGELSSWTKKKFDENDTKKLPLTLMRSGASFEDNLLPFFKPINHFFDPYNNRGLAIKSPDWILEDESDYIQQQYSYKDARQYMYEALTSVSDEGRSENFANLFRSLGHVIHHVGDMTQPQHVRHDAHLIGFDTSFYEGYTASVTVGIEEDESNEVPVDAHLQSQLFAQFDGYAPVIFTNPRDYWHTEGEGNYNGMGLAEFTNREFVSKDTNFGMPDAKAYDRPSKDNSTAFTLDDVSTIFTAYGMSVPAKCQDSENPCAMKFYSMQVTDKLRAERSGQNSFATTESIFNEDIKKYNETERCADPISMSYQCRTVLEERFTLNKINFWSSYPFLLSRAVGYSAGLLNYFFRGRLEVEELKYSRNEVTFKIKNAVDIEQYPEWTDESLVAGGNFVVAYAYRTVDGMEVRKVTAEVILNEDIAPQQTSEQAYSFIYDLPTGAVLMEERLVYRGQLGEELANTVDEGAVAFGVFEADTVLLALNFVLLEQDTFSSSTGQIWRSLDAGQSWQVVYQSADETRSANPGIWQINESEILARVQSGDYVVSNNLGKTWQSVNREYFIQTHPLAVSGWPQRKDIWTVRATGPELSYLRMGMSEKLDRVSLYRTPFTGEPRIWHKISDFAAPLGGDSTARAYIWNISDLGSGIILATFAIKIEEDDFNYIDHVKSLISQNGGVSWSDLGVTYSGDEVNCGYSNNPIMHGWGSRGSGYWSGTDTATFAADAGIVFGMRCYGGGMSRSFDYGVTWRDESADMFASSEPLFGGVVDDRYINRTNYLGAGRVTAYIIENQTERSGYPDSLNDAIYLSEDYGATWTQQAARISGGNTRGEVDGWPGSLFSQSDRENQTLKGASDLLDSIITVTRNESLLGIVR